MPAHVVIIGAGPIGIELAIALRRAGHTVRQLDAGTIGETIYRFPPQMRFFSSSERIALAGVPLQTADQSKCLREEYLAYLRSIVGQFDLDIRTYERVNAIGFADGGFVVRSRGLDDREHEHAADAVVLATGGTTRPRRLGIPGEELAHVTHDLGDTHRFFGRRVLVVGGRNSAVEAALRCYHIGADVTIAYRGTAFPRSVKYWLRPEIEMLIETGRVDGRLGTVPTAIRPGVVTLESTDGGAPHEVDADFVLLMIGYEADMSLCRIAGVEFGKRDVPVFDERTMETNVKGLYVAGTAAAGTQERYAVFLENCHVHVDRITAALSGTAPPKAPAPEPLPES